MSDHNPTAIPSQLEQVYERFRAGNVVLASVMRDAGLVVELRHYEETKGQPATILGYVDGAQIWRNPRTGRTFCGRCFKYDCKHVETWLVNFEF